MYEICPYCNKGFDSNAFHNCEGFVFNPMEWDKRVKALEEWRKQVERYSVIQDALTFVELQEENAKLKEELEQTRVQLAGCSVAASGNTRKAALERITNCDDCRDECDCTTCLKYAKDEMLHRLEVVEEWREKLTREHLSNESVFNRNAELEKENAELKAENKRLQLMLKQREDEIEGLKQQPLDKPEPMVCSKCGYVLDGKNHGCWSYKAIPQSGYKGEQK